MPIFRSLALYYKAVAIYRKCTAGENRSRSAPVLGGNMRRFNCNYCALLEHAVIKGSGELSASIILNQIDLENYALSCVSC